MTLRELLQGIDKWLRETSLYIGDGFQLVWRGDVLDAEIPQLFLPMIALGFGTLFYWGTVKYLWREHGRESVHLRGWLELPIKSKLYRLFEVAMFVVAFSGVTWCAYYLSPFY